MIHSKTSFALFRILVKTAVDNVKKAYLAKYNVHANKLLGNARTSSTNVEGPVTHYSSQTLLIIYPIRQTQYDRGQMPQLLTWLLVLNDRGNAPK